MGALIARAIEDVGDRFVIGIEVGRDAHEAFKFTEQPIR